jgi:hypothetical protein
MINARPTAFYREKNEGEISGDLDVEWRMILICILKYCVLMCDVDSCFSGSGQVAGFCG